MEPSLLSNLISGTGADPAMASSPFVATFVDVSGIAVIFNIARFWVCEVGRTIMPFSLWIFS